MFGALYGLELAMDHSFSTSTVNLGQYDDVICQLKIMDRTECGFNKTIP